MQEATEQPTLAPEAADDLAASALQAEAWAGEPFLHPDEDPGIVLAPGTARRRALDDALTEIEAGAEEPSYGWKIRYSLMLGLERVLSADPPRLASGTELRRHPGAARPERQRRRTRGGARARGGRRRPRHSSRGCRRGAGAPRGAHR